MLLKKSCIEIVYTKNVQLKDLLSATKDVTPDFHKSGICEIIHGDCGAKYIGQIRKRIEI